MSGLPTAEQFRVLAYAYLDSAEILAKKMIDRNEGHNYPLGCVAMYVARHAVGLFLKAALLQRSALVEPTHVLDRLAEKYAASFAEQAFQWDVPFLVQAPGGSDEEIALARKEITRSNPMDQLLRYPTNNDMAPWGEIAAFDADSFMATLSTIRHDFERLRPLIFR